MTPQNTAPESTAAATPAPAPPASESLGHKLLTDLEKVGLGLVAAAPAAAPVFIHSDRGVAIFNASENLFAAILAQFANRGN